MPWNRDDSIFFYLACSLTFALGFLGCLLGLLGLVAGGVVAFLAMRLLGTWLRERFAIPTDLHDDRLDDAMRSAGVVEAITGFLHGNRKA